MIKDKKAKEEHLEAKEPELPAKPSELEQTKEQAEDYKNKYLRALADFDNFKKRSKTERLQVIQFANENLVLELLPIIDNLTRALASFEGELKNGLALIKKQLEDILRKHGAEEISALNQPFDPNFHEAILLKEHDGPENMVIEEVQKGYTFHGKVIRPAMVIVSKLKEEEKNNG